MTEELRNKSFITEESFCVQNETYLFFNYGPVDSSVRRKEIQAMLQEQDVYLVTEEGGAYVCSRHFIQRIIFWAAVIAAWTPGLFLVSPHPKKGVCLWAIEQTAVFTVFGELVLSMVKTPVQVFCMQTENVDIQKDFTDKVWGIKR